jgi:hypothetical protein
MTPSSGSSELFQVDAQVIKGRKWVDYIGAL